MNRCVILIVAFLSFRTLYSIDSDVTEVSHQYSDILFMTNQVYMIRFSFPNSCKFDITIISLKESSKFSVTTFVNSEAVDKRDNQNEYTFEYINPRQECTAIICDFVLVSETYLGYVMSNYITHHHDDEKVIIEIVTINI